MFLYPKTPPAYESRYTPPPPEVPAAIVSVIGDSYTSGSGMGGQGDHGWPALVERQLNPDHPVSILKGAEGASGYGKPGHNGTDFAAEVPKVVKSNSRLVVVFGSRNNTEHLQDLPAAVDGTLAAIKVKAPTASLLVIGPAWPVGEPPPEVLEARDIIRTEAVKAHAVWVDPITDGWLVGHPELIGEDGIHPNDAGHVWLAEKIGALIVDQLSPPVPCTTAAPFGHTQVNCPT
jgi:lysophospholipase L1-like esterase